MRASERPAGGYAPPSWRRRHAERATEVVERVAERRPVQAAQRVAQAAIRVGRRRADPHGRFDAFAAALTVLSLDEPAGREAGRLRALREAAGSACQPSDMMIAGIVSVAGAALATRNVRDFSGLPIQVLDPWRAGV